MLTWLGLSIIAGLGLMAGVVLFWLAVLAVLWMLP